MMRFISILNFSTIILILSYSALVSQNTGTFKWNSDLQKFIPDQNNSNHYGKIDMTGDFELLGPGNNDIAAFSFADSDADTVFAATHENGVYKSVDGCFSWQQKNNGLSDMFVRSLDINPNNPDIILAGTYHDGLFISEDGGELWEYVSAVDDTTIFDILYSPVYENYVYAGTINKGVYRSTDGGTDWEHITPNMPYKAREIYTDPNFSNIVYFLSEDTIFKSTDYGDSWTNFFQSPDDTPFESFATEKGNSSILFAGTFNTLYKSTDGGMIWDPLITYPNLIILDILLHPENSDTLYFGCAAFGLYKSDNAGDTWDLIDNGGNSFPVKKLKFHPQLYSTVYVASNDFALLRHGYPFVSVSNLLLENSGLRNYPNPAVESTVVEYYFDGKTENISLQIYNESGYLVNIFELNPTEVGLNRFVLNTSSFPEGFYFYGIQYNEAKVYKKMIITK